MESRSPKGEEELFLPADPHLYGPEPGRTPPGKLSFHELFGLSSVQFGFVLVTSLLVFTFLGGPVWSAARSGFPLRLFTSYAVIPVMIVPLSWWNGELKPWTAIFATAMIGGLKLVLTAGGDVVQGMLRHWPP